MTDPAFEVIMLVVSCVQDLNELMVVAEHHRTAETDMTLAKRWSQ